MKELLDKMRAGDRRALARLISRIEDRDPATHAVLAAIYGERARLKTLGLTGPPGAGKSTLGDQLIARIREQGQSVAVVAIDPSSPFSGGALLGDRIRMNRHATDPGVFIRSFGTRGSLGGLSHATRQVLLLFAAAGFDWALVETVGVGQTELDIMGVVGTTVVVLVPESGDTVQTMKAGLTEIADIFVVNKADREGAGRMRSDLELMVHLKDDPDWQAPVLLTQARSGQGVGELFAQVLAHQRAMDESPRREARLARALRHEFAEVLEEKLRTRVLGALDGGALSDLARALDAGDVNPYEAALEVLSGPGRLAEILGPPPPAHKKR